jgi:metal-responsive CopG/Arc/MetJ family transcriptional regulator
MASSKIAITLDTTLVRKIDHLVRDRIFPSRSRAIQDAVAEKMVRYDRGRLASECAKLNPKEEQTIAEEGLSSEVEQWPVY